MIFEDFEEKDQSLTELMHDKGVCNLGYTGSVKYNKLLMSYIIENHVDNIFWSGKVLLKKNEDKITMHNVRTVKMKQVVNRPNISGK